MIGGLPGRERQIGWGEREVALTLKEAPTPHPPRRESARGERRSAGSDCFWAVLLLKWLPFNYKPRPLRPPTDKWPLKVGSSSVQKRVAFFFAQPESVTIAKWTLCEAAKKRLHTSEIFSQSRNFGGHGLVVLSLL